MMPEQLPDITQDKGIQQDCRLTVKNMLQHKRFTIAELSTDIEELVYQAMLRGMQNGLGYGWRIGQQRLLEQQKRDRVFAKQMGL